MAFKFMRTFENANFEVSKNGAVESARLAVTLYPADDVAYSHQDTNEHMQIRIYLLDLQIPYRV